MSLQTQPAAPLPSQAGGRLTLPIQTGMDDEVRRLIARLGADAVRNSDGTELPGIVSELATKVYSTYFVGRGDNAWADAHPDEATRIFLMSDRVSATTDGPVSIDLLASWFADQVRPDTGCDVTRWWQAHDRTTGEELPASAWSIEADGRTVTVHEALAGHVYTVSFLAIQTWDPTQMYNYLTNGWDKDPTRVKEKPFDVRHEATWSHVRAHLSAWLTEHPEVDVVRFTTFFYHFTLVYGADATERFVDWFGYSASVSVPALEAFEEEYGYRLTAEDFVDAGYYNNPFRMPSPRFRDWISFQSRFVASRAKGLVDIAHEAGREAMMFLGDNWIGMEPYGPYFPSIKMDAVVGSVGSAATCRMISDIPGVRYTEGRFLPYFFPDVFREGGDPLGEANKSWRTARRAIVRSPLDRMGYGGYLSLALKFPEFIDRVEEILAEFRSLHEATGGEKPACAPVRVAVLNAWGKLRTWQTHMVAHALWYKQIHTYLGVIEALAGLPFDVRFMSFDEVIEGGTEALEDVDVVINAGAANTSFSGGQVWEDLRLQDTLRRFVARGGGFIGIGQPTASVGTQGNADRGGICRGSVFALSDVLGVDQEISWSLSKDHYEEPVSEHFITADLDGDYIFGEDPGDVVVTDSTTDVLVMDRGSVRASAHDFCAGRGVYLAGLTWSTANSRLLHRAIMWAAHAEDQWESVLSSSNPDVEVAWYPESALAFVYNDADAPRSSEISGQGGQILVELAAGQGRWVEWEKGQLL